MRTKLIGEVRRLQKIAGLLKEDAIDLSDTPTFKKRKEEFYVYDLQGIDPPEGPYSKEEAYQKVKILNRHAPDYAVVNGEIADELWGLDESDDIDLSDTPEFSNTPSVEELQNSPTYVFVVDGGYWGYYSFGIGDVRGRCYLDTTSFEDFDEEEGDGISRLKKGWTAKKVIKAAKELGFIEKVGGDWMFYDETEGELTDWLDSIRED